MADTQNLDPDVRAALQGLLAEGAQKGLSLRVTSGYRDRAKQQQLYNDFLAGRSPYPAAPPGGSNHERGLAVDIVNDGAGGQEALAKLAGKYGFNWKGNYDRVHFDYAGPKNDNSLDFLQSPAQRARQGQLQQGVAGYVAKQNADQLADQFANSVKGASPAALADQFATAARSSAPSADALADQFAHSFKKPAASANELADQFAATVKPSRTAGLKLSPALAGASDQRPVVNGIRVNLAGTEPDKLGGLFPQGGGTGAAIKTTATAVGKGITAATTPLSVMDAFANQLGKERARAENQAGTADLNLAQQNQVLLKAIRNTPWKDTAKKGITGQEFTPFSPLSTYAAAGTSDYAKWVKTIHPEVVDFISSFPIQELAGKLQNAGLDRIAGLVKKAGITEKIAAKMPALNDYLQGKKAMTATQEIMGRNAAGTEGYLREAADTAKDVQQTSQKYVKAGAPIRGANPHTGQPTNVFDTLVADYIDAGNKGSKFEHIHPPEPPTPQTIQAAENVFSVLHNARKAVPKILAEHKGAQAAADQFLDNVLTRARTAGGGAVQELLAKPGQEAAAAQGALDQTLTAARGAGAAKVQGLRAAGQAKAARQANLIPNLGEAARQGLQKITRDSDLVKAADALALHQYNETTDAIRYAGLSKDDLAEMLAQMKAAARGAVHDALQRGEETGAAAQAAEAASRTALLQRVGVKGRARVQQILGDTANQEAAKQALMQRLQTGGKKGVQQALQAGADQTARGQATMEQVLATAQTKGVAAVTNALHQAGAPAREAAAAETYLNGVLDRARGAIPKIEADQADLMQARAERRGAEIGKIAEQAKAYGVDMKDVQRIGDRYSRTLDTLGQKLVDYGLLDPKAYAELQGQYLPRLYLLTKGDPTNVEGYLKFLEGNGALTPQAMMEAKARLTGKSFGPGLGPKAFTKGRELTDFEQRNAPEFARAMIPEATPAAIHGIGAQARAVGEAAGHAEIAANPELAAPVDQVTAAQAKAGWQPFRGNGPLAGHAIHPGVAKILEWRKLQNPGPIYNTLKQVSPQAADTWQRAMGTMRKLWLSSPRTQLNIINGHYQLVHDAAAINGATFELPQYVKALGELRAFDKGGLPSPYLQEALNQTNILSEGASLLPKEARAVTGTFGVETPLEKAKQLPGKAWAAYRGVTHDALAGGKYGLFVALRQAGKSVPEAAKIVKAAAIDYSDVNPIIRALERDNLAPFITFPLKAVSQYLNQAARRPDLFYTATGQRARDFLDRLAGPEAQEKRRSGAAGPADFPIPGKKNEFGEQAYARIPFLAPALHHFLHAGPEASDIVTEQLTHGNPLWTTAKELATNQQDIGHGKTIPISPFGAVPGKPGMSGEKAADYGKYLAKKAFPEAADAFRLARAVQGRPEYDTLSSPVPKVPDTVLRALTGVTTNASLGQNKIQKGMAMGQRLQQSRNPELEKFVTDYTQSLAPQFTRDLTFVPNREYGQVAEGIPSEKLPEAIKNATDSFSLALMRSVGPLAARKKAVKDRLDWVWALGVAASKAGIADIQGLTPQERTPLGSVFGGSQ